MQSTKIVKEVFGNYKEKLMWNEIQTPLIQTPLTL